MKPRTCFNLDHALALREEIKIKSTSKIGENAIPRPSARSVLDRAGLWLMLLAAALAILSGTVSGADAPPAPGGAAKAEVTFQKDILPFLTNNCFACHGNGKAKADLALDKYKDDLSILNDRKVWENVIHMLQKREMPPEKEPQPSQTDVDKVLAAINGVFDKLDCAGGANAGRVTLRRLNKTEYNNTIRDLVGVDFKPADDFPADDVGYGFDNIGDVLSVSPLLLEKYLEAAEAILDQAILVYEPPKSRKSPVGAIRLPSLITQREVGGMMSFDEGDYFVRASLGAEQAGSRAVRAMFRVGGKDVQEFEIKAATNQAAVFEAKVRMKPGTERVTVALSTRASGSDGNEGKLYVRDIEVEGPFDTTPPQYPPSHVRLMAHKEGVPSREAAREIIARFAAKAFRRPVQPEEVEKCLALFDAAQAEGQRFELCVRTALYRVLVSPHFLFRIELDPPGVAEGTAYPVSEHELASRLSYFLWNSMPDDELMRLAEKGQLRWNLEVQVRRMLGAPQSGSFLKSFSEQWLTLRKLDLASPDPDIFPAFNKDLRQAMLRESELFFETIAREDRSILDLLQSDFVLVNEPLAALYGVAGVKGKAFVRVKAPPHRGGVLTMASVLALNSNATRTSPVKRGKFILEEILNTPPPPPPANVPPLEEDKQLTGTLRQIMEQHRDNALCASCHQKMDPLGFAFENFDAIGAWRDKDIAGFAIDASGVLPGGGSFAGADELKKILQANRGVFLRCVTEKMLTYALGRGLEYYDRCAVNKIMEELERNNHRFSTLVLGIVKSDPFQLRTATGEKL
jgi:mono/diheme cytochrome c family protein